MPLNLDNFTFHSNNTPYGTVYEETRTFNWQGTTVSVGNEMLTDEIKIPTLNTSIKVLVKVPSTGSWGILYMGAIQNNEVIFNESLLEVYSPTFVGHMSPVVKRTANGVRFGIRRSWAVQTGPMTGTRTFPSREFELKLVVDILPRIEGII